MPTAWTCRRCRGGPALAGAAPIWPRLVPGLLDGGEAWRYRGVACAAEIAAVGAEVTLTLRAGFGETLLMLGLTPRAIYTATHLDVTLTLSAPGGG